MNDYIKYQGTYNAGLGFRFFLCWIGSICSGGAPDDVVMLHEFVPAVQASLDATEGAQPAFAAPVIEAVFLLLKAIADNVSGSAFRNVGGVPIATARTHTRHICIGTGACPCHSCTQKYARRC